MDDQSQNQQPSQQQPPQDEQHQNSVLKVNTEDIDAEQERLDYLRQIAPPKKPKRGKWVILALLLLIILVGVGYVVYKRMNNTKTTTSSTTTQAAQKSTTKSTTDTTEATKDYESTAMGLTFAYPESWSVNEATGNKIITATSPVQDIKTAQGTTVKGKIVLTISPKGQNVAAFATGDAVAVRDSVKINYANPSSSQRAATYVSFLQYNSTTTKGALDAVDITGDYGYKRLQTIPKSDIAAIDPLLAITFIQCSDNQCTNSTAVNIPSDMWDTTSFSKPLMAVFSSLRIQ